MPRGRDLLTAGFGEAVRELRLKAALSQERLAAMSRLHRTYIGDIERGLKSPSLRAVERIARALDRRPSDLTKRAEELSDWR
jgi:XRE family transcriptional regulator, regulator of sulfur utilization